MRNTNNLVEALEFYANPLNWFGAPADVYKDSGKKALEALACFYSDKSDWWADNIGLGLSDINALQKRMGNKLWDSIIHIGGISTGVWRPWPGEAGDEVRAILKLYKSRQDFRKANCI